MVSSPHLFTLNISGSAANSFSTLILIVAAVGHHGAPQALLRLLPKNSLARKWLQKWTTGELEGEHYYDAAHRAYNEAISKFEEFRTAEGRQNLVDQGEVGARRLGQKILDSDNPAIENFLDNMRTSEGLTGREALQKAIDAGDAESIVDVVTGAIAEGGGEFIPF